MTRIPNLSGVFDSEFLFRRALAKSRQTKLRAKSRRREKLSQTMLKLAELKNKMRSQSIAADNFKPRDNFEPRGYVSGNRLFKLARSRVMGREREYVPSVEDRLEDLVIEDLAINEASGIKKMMKLERKINAESKKINALKGVLDGFRRFYLE